MKTEKEMYAKTGGRIMNIAQTYVEGLKGVL